MSIAGADEDTAALTHEVEQLQQELHKKQQELRRQQYLERSVASKLREDQKPRVSLLQRSPTPTQRTARKSAPHVQTEECPVRDSLPLNQIRGVLRERMRARIMNDKSQLRKVFEKYDTDAGGTIDVEEFQAVLEDIGVPLTIEQARSFMKRLSGGPTQLSFAAMFGNLLGLPHKFFETTMNPKPRKAANPTAAVYTMGKRLPSDTATADVQNLVVRKLKDKWLNPKNSLTNVLRKPHGCEFMSSADLFNVFWKELGFGLSPQDIDLMMAHFGVRGKIHYKTFLEELLGLSIPKQSRQLYIPPFRPPLNERCLAGLRKLKLRCERGSARQSQLLKMFQAYDEDGSGSLTHNEFEAVCTDLGIGVDKRNVPSELLQSYDNAQHGSLTYSQFLSDVMGLEPELLCGPEPPKTPHLQRPPSRPGTPVIVDLCQQRIKEMVLGSRDASQKAFEAAFDRTGEGTLRKAHFKDGLADLGIACTQHQADQLFKEYDVENRGVMSLDTMGERVLDYGSLERELNTSIDKLEHSQQSLQGSPSPTVEASPVVSRERAQTPFATTTAAHQKTDGGQIPKTVSPAKKEVVRPQTSLGDRFLRSKEGVQRMLRDEWLHKRTKGRSKGTLVAGMGKGGSRPVTAQSGEVRDSGVWWEDGELNLHATKNLRSTQFGTKPPASANTLRTAMAKQKVKMASASWDLPSGLKVCSKQPDTNDYSERPATALDRVCIIGSSSRPSSVPLLQRPTTPYRPFATLKGKTDYGTGQQSTLALASSFRGGVL